MLNEAKTPPFPVADDTPVSEDVRLQYRYLDLRRPRLQSNIGLRHRVTLRDPRGTSTQNGFWEIETPILTKSTPEGARDYLVPSRVHPGEFYALPQSPQIFKQILMIGGHGPLLPDRASASATRTCAPTASPSSRRSTSRCRSRGPRPIFGMIEPLMPGIFAVIGVDVPTPFRRMPYAEAMAKYGSDKPDLRFGMRDRGRRRDVSPSPPFRVFREIVAERRRGPRLRRAGRRQVLAQRDRRHRRPGQADRRGGPHLGAAGRGRRSTTIVKALGEATLRAVAATQSGCGDGATCSCSRRAQPDATSKLLGAAPAGAREAGEPARPATSSRSLWVVDFPLLEWDREDGRWVLDAPSVHLAARRGHRHARHRPGRGARQGLRPRAERQRDRRRQHPYPRLGRCRRRIFQLLNISDEEAKLRFGFFLEALEYGTPPHGGIALGLDRIVAILASESSIREVIAFPKTAAAVDLMADAPSPVDAQAAARAAPADDVGK